MSYVNNVVKTDEVKVIKHGSVYNLFVCPYCACEFYHSYTPSTTVKLDNCQVNAGEIMSGICSYVVCPECDRGFFKKIR